MKVKIVMSLIGLFVIMCSSFAQNFNRISKDIKEAQLSIEPRAKKYIDCYYNLRKKSKMLKEFFPMTKNDTVFILEQHGDWSDLALTSTIWNANKTISYYSESPGKIFSLTDKPQFIKYMIRLVSEWNIEAIKKEEIENGNIIPSQYVFATRIIFNGKRYQIDCLSFKEFFNLQRDRFDFRE